MSKSEPRKPLTPEDLLNDPAHPDRPQHPDFWRLSEIILQLDGRAQEEGLSSVFKSILVDGPSLQYMIEQRVLRFRMIGSVNPFMLKVMYAEAFLMGYRFHEQEVNRDV